MIWMEYALRAHLMWCETMLNAMGAFSPGHAEDARVLREFRTQLDAYGQAESMPSGETENDEGER